MCEIDRYDVEQCYDSFIADLDSWFSSDIACCDNCYNEFVKQWPLAFFAEDSKFQRQGIDMRSFYDGSRRIKHDYSYEYFVKLIKNINCPMCGAPLGGTIWAYDLPFSIPYNFFRNIREIEQLSQNTPFLLYTNQFSQKVFELLKKIYNNSSKDLYPDYLFRARFIKSLNSFDYSEFDFPPKEYVQEGRYNHAGIPVLYLGNSLSTCFYELREQTCVIAKIKINKEITILDLVETDKILDYHDDDYDLLNAIIFSTLISSKQIDSGMHKPNYVFSRFLRDCAIYIGFDAIKYPSTRAFSDVDFNIAFLNTNISLNNGLIIDKLFLYDKNNFKEIK